MQEPCKKAKDPRLQKPNPQGWATLDGETKVKIFSASKGCSTRQELARSAKVLT